MHINVQSSFIYNFNKTGSNGKSFDGWRFKLWYIHTIKYDPVKKKKKRSEILTHTTWMDFKDITLSEKSQCQKAAYYMVPLIQCSQRTKLQRRNKRLPGDGGSGCDQKGAHTWDCSWWRWNTSLSWLYWWLHKLFFLLQWLYFFKLFFIVYKLLRDQIA